MKFNSFEEVEKFLYSDISTAIKKQQAWDEAIKRTKYLLKLLGDPQDKIKVIHIAGTSGKGSTAYLTSLILKSLNLKVGLQLSPHLVDLRERIQINNQLITKEQFVNNLNEILPYIYQVRSSAYGMPSYYEILTVLAFYTFYKEKVDYAVMETGLGGLYDATNTVTSENKFVVLTKIGLDHTNILGKTIAKIALQKAEIIQQQNQVLSIWQEKSAGDVIKKIVDQRNAKLTYIKKGHNFKNIHIDENKTIFDFSFNGLELKQIKLGLLGEHQAENCTLALTCIYQICQRDGIKFLNTEVREALKIANFPGRFDIKQINHKKVILDGAHNPQKMKGFIFSLKKIFPNQKFTFLIAFKNDKNFSQMIKLIIPVADQIVVTKFFGTNQDWLHLSQDPKNIGAYLARVNFTNYRVVENDKTAFQEMIRNKENIVVTGSLYLLSDIYTLFN